MSTRRADFGCAGYKTETQNGTEHDCGHKHAGHVSCEECRFCKGSNGLFDPRYPMEQIRNHQAAKLTRARRSMVESDSKQA